MLFKFKENIGTLIASSFRSTPVLLTHTLTGKLNSNYIRVDTQRHKCLSPLHCCCCSFQGFGTPDLCCSRTHMANTQISRCWWDVGYSWKCWNPQVLSAVQLQTFHLRNSLSKSLQLWWNRCCFEMIQGTKCHYQVVSLSEDQSHSLLKYCHWFIH